MTSGTEPATFRLEAQCRKQLHYENIQFLSVEAEVHNTTSFCTIDLKVQQSYLQMQ
jgi:hypothetical protein